MALTPRVALPVRVVAPTPNPNDRLGDPDGFAYYTALPATTPRHLRKLTALEQMYGYYSTE